MTSSSSQFTLHIAVNFKCSYFCVTSVTMGSTAAFSYLATCFRLNESPSLLELIFTNESDMIDNLLYLPPLGKSDHFCMEFNLMCYAEQKKSDNVKYNIRGVNFDMMR